MGIFIELHVAQNVTDTEWASVYAESLILAKKFHLMDLEVMELFGEKLYCGIPVKEQEWGGIRFWETIGDYETMGRAEEQRLPRKLMNTPLESSTSKSYDPLLSVAPSRTMLDWEDERCQNSSCFWGNKTQGEAYHMYLLAIGCMIESRLNGKACVSGDITLGQCRKAIALANHYLDEPIGLPVRCNLEQLYQRVRNLPLHETESLNLFQNLYLGSLNIEYGKFVKDHFSQKERTDFWKHEFQNCKIGTIGFCSSLKQCLNLGNDLDVVCEILLSEYSKDEKTYEHLILEIMRTNLFLENKDLRDCLEIDKETEAPYTIYTLMAQFVYSGAANYNVNAYLPLKKIQEILCRHFGAYCDVQKIINEYLEQMANEKAEKPSEMLNNFMDSAKDSMEQDMGVYDICTLSELINFETGDKMKPSLEKTCIEYLKFYKKACQEASFDELMRQSTRDKCAFLIYQNRHLFLMKKRWLEIFDEIERKPECFRRYYPMVRVQLNDDAEKLVYAYVANDDFYHYCEKKLVDFTTFTQRKNQSIFR